MAGRKGANRNAIAERRRMVLLNVRRGFPLTRIRQELGVGKSTLARDLTALRKQVPAEEAKILRRLILANVRGVFKPKDALSFISLCQEIIRGKAKLPVNVLPKYSKAHTTKAQKIINLLLATDKSIHQVAKKTGASRKAVTAAYHSLLTRGEVVPKRRTRKVPANQRMQINAFTPEERIKIVEDYASKAGLTVQEKAVAYCKVVGMQQRDLAGMVDVSEQLISNLAESSRKKMAKIMAAKSLK